MKPIVGGMYKGKVNHPATGPWSSWRIVDDVDKYGNVTSSASGKTESWNSNYWNDWVDSFLGAGHPVKKIWADKDTLRGKVETAVGHRDIYIEPITGGYMVEVYNLPKVKLPKKYLGKPVLYRDLGDYPDR